MPEALSTIILFSCTLRAGAHPAWSLWPILFFFKENFLGQARRSRFS